MEDVIEELIGEEIVDETDQYVDVHRRIAVARARLANVRHKASAPVGVVNAVGGAKKGRPKMITSRSMSQPDTVTSMENLQDTHKVFIAGLPPLPNALNVKEAVVSLSMMLCWCTVPFHRVPLTVHFMARLTQTLSCLCSVHHTRYSTGVAHN